ncbi:acylneuraminate cytidylyltransferase family protein [Loktanella sp. Alg231-35]|uniref:acylneuraminate cytidylyltransferase family protein n=1 Tax=Loktanella sp. Alg231-35 TaxID=1922220 RepID=UPI000D55CA1A|nr:acylneuraminate cytidylyltransferase family protein [Loktanella sp. Alg231-35]
MIIGHIGARAGSKGVPGKNFRMLHGKHLIDWSLGQLLDSDRVDHVVVSSDSPEIYEHGLKRGCLDIGLRPAHLATDTAAKWGVWQHALGEVEKQIGPADAFLDLDCTSPLRLPKDIDAGLDLFEAEQPDMVMSCCVSGKNPYFNMLETDDDGALQVSKPLPHGVVARQQAPMVYDHVGLVYVVKPSYLRTASRLFEGHVIPLIVPNERGLDVDSFFDWEVIDFLMGKQIAEGLRD